jgi:SlyX protein
MASIEQLEFKVAFQEDSIEQLNNIIIKQQDTVDRQGQLIQALMDKLKTIQSDTTENNHGETNQGHELPPHY